MVAFNLHYKDAVICNNTVPISDVKGPDIVGRVVFHNYSNVFVYMAQVYGTLRLLYFVVLLNCQLLVATGSMLRFCT